MSGAAAGGAKGGAKGGGGGGDEKNPKDNIGSLGPTSQLRPLKPSAKGLLRVLCVRLRYVLGCVGEACMLCWRSRGASCGASARLER